MVQLDVSLRFFLHEAAAAATESFRLCPPEVRPCLVAFAVQVLAEHERLSGQLVVVTNLPPAQMEALFQR